MNPSRWLLLIVLVIGVLLAACGGDNGDNDDASDNPADLAISSVEVDPAQPKVNQPFTIRVKVKNQGKTESVSYSVVVTVRDVTRGEQVPVGTFPGGPIKAGSETTVYEGVYHGLNKTGSYQVQAQLGYNVDSNSGNNQLNKAFTVVE